MTSVNPMEGGETFTARPRRRMPSKTGLVGICIVGAWVLVALFGHLIAPFDEAQFASDTPFLEPSRQFLLGTDYLARDLWSRLLIGTQLTLAMAVGATLIASTVGTSIGIFAAITGGWKDMVLSRLNDAFLSFPTTIMALVVIAALGSSIPVLVIVTGLIYSASVFRIARALAMDQAVMDYVEVAKARGEGIGWIMVHEILPNIAPPLMVDFGLRLGFAILFLSALSFLGLGVQPPLADWGSMVRENMTGLTSGAITPIYPAVAIASLTVALNLIVDDLATRSGHTMSSKLI